MQCGKKLEKIPTSGNSQPVRSIVRMSLKSTIIKGKVFFCPSKVDVMLCSITLLDIKCKTWLGLGSNLQKVWLKLTSCEHLHTGFPFGHRDQPWSWRGQDHLDRNCFRKQVHSSRHREERARISSDRKAGENHLPTGSNRFLLAVEMRNCLSSSSVKTSLFCLCILTYHALK